MRPAAILRSLGPIDARSVARDSFLAWMVPLPLVLGALLRFALPALVAWGRTELGLDLAPYLPLVVGYFAVLLVPLLVGMVVGFVLLDERDDDTLTALLVTPLPIEGYVAWRIGVPLLLCGATGALAILLVGQVHVPASALAPILAVSALEAPMLALATASVVQNKVQGFAFLKVVSALQLVPVAGWFAPAPWRWAAGLWPAFWPVQAYWAAEAGDASWPGYAAAGLVLHLGLLALLLRHFRRVVHR